MRAAATKVVDFQGFIVIIADEITDDPVLTIFPLEVTWN
jgi:hypothetical protein